MALLWFGRAKKEFDMQVSALSDAVEGLLISCSYNTQRMYTQIWHNWLRCLNKNPFDANPIDAARYINDFQKTPIQKQFRKGKMPARGTVKTYVMVLYAIYKRLIEQEVITTKNPFLALFNDWKNVQVERVREAPPVADHKVMELIRKPLEHGNEGLRDSAYLAILFGAGLRRCEAIKLNIRDVLDMDGHVVLNLLQRKNRDDVKQPLPDWASDILRKYMELDLRSDALFVAFNKAGDSTGRRVSIETMYRRFKYWCKVVGLHHTISPHSARRTSITRLLDSGMSHRDVQAFSGHKSIAMVQLYDSRRLGVKEHPAVFLSYEEKKILPQKLKASRKRNKH